MVIFHIYKKLVHVKKYDWIVEVTYVDRHILAGRQTIIQIIYVFSSCIEVQCKNVLSFNSKFREREKKKVERVISKIWRGVPVKTQGSPSWKPFYLV